jgi:hypothetical protein
MVSIQKSEKCGGEMEKKTFLLASGGGRRGEWAMEIHINLSPTQSRVFSIVFFPFSPSTPDLLSSDVAQPL